MNLALKWYQTILVSWSNLMTYRMNFFLQVIGPSLIFFFVKYSLWTCIYEQGEKSIIQGYSLSEMLTYQAWVLIIALVGQGHSSMNLSEDIRMGRISTYLIYPFNFWQFHTASFIAFQFLQVVIVLFTIFCISLTPLISIQFNSFLTGLAFSVYMGFFWFCLQYLIGLLSFWLEETWVLRVMFLLIAQFLSGAILPLELYPEWFVSLLSWTPFPYLTYIPAKIFMGQYHEIAQAYLTLSLWMIVAIAACFLVWRKGLKLYSGSGM